MLAIFSKTDCMYWVLARLVRKLSLDFLVVAHMVVQSLDCHPVRDCLKLMFEFNPTLIRDMEHRMSDC